MTDFVETVRHRCRNKNCRKNLPAPAANDHHAFCKPWCHEAFYGNRCIRCERPLPPNSRSSRKLCNRPACRHAYAQNRALYDFPAGGSQNKSELPKTPVKGPVLTPQKRGQATQWRRVSAGPTLTLSQLRCVVVPDGPNSQWAGGSVERIEPQTGAR
jgi:hypothetical protein